MPESAAADVVIDTDAPDIDPTSDQAVIDQVFASLESETEAPDDEAQEGEEVEEAPSEDSDEEDQDEGEEEPEASDTDEESPEDPPAAVPPSDPDVVARLERVAASERELSRRRRDFDAQRAELARMEEALKAQQEQASAAAEFLRELNEGDPLKALSSRGISFEKLAEGVATGTGINPNKGLEDRQAKLERELQEYKTAEANARAAAEDEARRNAALAEISEVAQTKSPVIAAMGQEGAAMVFQIARDTAKTTGKVPDYDTLFRDAQQNVLSFVERFKDVPEVKALFGVSENGKQTNKQAASKTVSNATATKVAKRKTEDVDLTTMPDDELFDYLYG